MCPKKVPLLFFWITRSKISGFQQSLVCTESWGNLRLVGYKFAHFTWKMSLHYLVKLLLPACYRNINNKCFNEEIKASNKNCKVNESAVCFLYIFSVLFYSGSLYCFNLSLYCFLWEKVGGFEKSRLLGGCEKNRLLLLTLTFITNTKQ